MRIQKNNLKTFLKEFTEDANIRIEETCLLIENKYKNKDVFSNCLDFIYQLSFAFYSKSELGIIATMFSLMDSRME